VRGDRKELFAMPMHIHLAVQRGPALIVLLVAMIFVSPVTAGPLDGWTTGETHRLAPGVFYHQLRKAPPAAGGAVGALPVALDRELAASFEYGDRAAAFAPIEAAVQLRVAETLGLRTVIGAELPSQGAPRVYVGSAIGDLAPPSAEESASPADRFPPIVLHVERPTRAWQAAARELMAREALTHLLLLRVSVSQYPKGRRGVFAKDVQLGTGHSAPVKFLTAEDKLLEVLQVTGLLLDAEGRVLRAGAEGVLARDTPFSAQVFDIMKLLDDAALRAALETERRPDLPGEPLSLEVAVDNLVAQLLQDATRARRPL